MLPFAERASASFIIDDWVIGVRVHDFSTGMVQTAAFLDVMNPFQDAHAVSLGVPPAVSAASAAYDFAWSEFKGTGSFHAEGSQQAVGVASSTLFSRSSGTILVTTTSDLLVGIDATYSYDLPPDSMLTILNVDIIRQDPAGAIYSESRVDDTFLGSPASGIFTINDQVLLPGGNTYSLNYRMLIQSFAGATGVIGTGSGTVDFQLIPEPSTLWLAVPGGLLLLLRGRRQRRPRTRRSPGPRIAASRIPLRHCAPPQPPKGPATADPKTVSSNSP